MRAIFLDRDGVLNVAMVRDGKPYPPPGIQAIQLYPDVAQALAQLKAAGFLLLVVTNQPDVSRGNQARAVVEAQNAAIKAELPIEEVFVCWHDDRDNCSCRKPKPGLLLEAAKRYPIDFAASFLIGDRWRDIDAGAAVGCRTILIDRHYYRERAPAAQPDFRAVSLQQAADWILKLN